MSIHTAAQARRGVSRPAARPETVLFLTTDTGGGHRAAVEAIGHALVVTDLATAHGTWWHRRVDLTITPSARLLHASRRARAGGLYGRPLGIPVRGQAIRPPIRRRRES